MWNRYYRRYKREQGQTSLNGRIRNRSDGAELIDFIPDRSLPDMDRWLEARLELEKCPPRVLAIAAKRASGLPLTKPERKCLVRFSRKRLGRSPRVLVPVAGHRIRELRQQLGWNRGEMAKRARLRPNTLFGYENSEHTLADRKILLKLARVLGVSLEYLTDATSDL